MEFGTSYKTPPPKAVPPGGVSASGLLAAIKYGYFRLSVYRTVHAPEGKNLTLSLGPDDYDFFFVSDRGDGEDIPLAMLVLASIHKITLYINFNQLHLIATKILVNLQVIGSLSYFRFIRIEYLHIAKFKLSI